jgi:hypothetical protein
VAGPETIRDLEKFSFAFQGYALSELMNGSSTFQISGSNQEKTATSKSENGS